MSQRWENLNADRLSQPKHLVSLSSVGLDVGHLEVKVQYTGPPLEFKLISNQFRNVYTSPTLPSAPSLKRQTPFTSSVWLFGRAPEPRGGVRHCHGGGLPWRPWYWPRWRSVGWHGWSTDIRGGSPARDRACRPLRPSWPRPGRVQPGHQVQKHTHNHTHTQKQTQSLRNICVLSHLLQPVHQ